MTIYDTQYWKDTWPDATLAMEEQSPEHIAQERELVDLLHSLEPLPETVLEVGCGYGRLARLIWDQFKPDAVTATDASPHALERAREYVGDRNINFVIRDLDFFAKTAKHELVITAELLMHRSPEEIVGDCATLAGLAQKYIVNIDWYEPGFDGPSPGCYQHDYATLFSKYGTVERIDVPAARQAIWVTTL